MKIRFKFFIVFAIMCFSVEVAYSQDCKSYLRRAAELVNQNNYCEAKKYYVMYSDCDTKADVSTEIAMCERRCRIPGEGVNDDTVSQPTNKPVSQPTNRNTIQTTNTTQTTNSSYSQGSTSTPPKPQNKNKHGGIGIQAGVNLSTLSGILKNLMEDPEIEINRKPGVLLGIIGDQPFGRSSWGLRSEFLFSQLGVNMKSNSTQWGYNVRETGTLNLYCIMAKAHIRVNLITDDGFGLTLRTGFHAGYGLWASYKYAMFVNDEKVDGDQGAFFGDSSNRAAELGFGIGADLNFSHNVSLGATYDMGIFFSNLAFSLNIKF